MTRLLTLPALLALATLGGCVSAGYHTRDRTTWEPNGVVTHEKNKDAQYSDTTGAGKAAGIALDEFGGFSGILNALGLGGSLATGGGILSLVTVAAHLLGQNKGYGQAQAEHAGLAPRLVKVKGTPTNA